VSGWTATQTLSHCSLTPLVIVLDERLHSQLEHLNIYLAALFYSLLVVCRWQFGHAPNIVVMSIAESLLSISFTDSNLVILDYYLDFD
jgi:hypothetical protein